MNEHIDFYGVALAVCNGDYSTDNIALALLALDTLNCDQEEQRSISQRLEALRPRKVAAA